MERIHGHETDSLWIIDKEIIAVHSGHYIDGNLFPQNSAPVISRYTKKEIDLDHLWEAEHH